jgi:hypothetical protein
VFTKPNLDGNGTNLVHRRPFDGDTVWLDHEEPDPRKRYKMASVDADNKYAAYTMLSSADGIKWSEEVAKTGPVSDCSRVGFNPFRQKWVFSIKVLDEACGGDGRARGYRESENLFNNTNWTSRSVYPWACADATDGVDELVEGGFTPQIYTLDIFPYESVLVARCSVLS